MKQLLCVLFLAAVPAFGQVNYGELRLAITDPSGAAVQTSVEVSSGGTGYDKLLASDAAGVLAVKHLPFGVYRVQVRQKGFAPYSQTFEVRSALPVDEAIHLNLAQVTTQVEVSAAETLIDPDNPSSEMYVGSKEIQQRLNSLPGRSVQDLVASQPGWLYEGNAVLHPRGAEYQTQIVVDGIPLTDNRSPSFGPEIEADDLDSVSVYTAGFPAEYGRQMGGVVELETRRQTDPGLHGEIVLDGGSYDTASGYGQVQEVAGKDTLAVTAAGSRSGHYLNPVVPENYTNNGTTGDFSARYERDMNAGDRLILNVRHELSRFEIPNELVQEQNGQLETGDDLETMGTVNYQHVISSDSLLNLAGMVRHTANDLNSNDNSTPIIAFEQNYFNEGYFKGTYSLHWRRHEFKAGVESDSKFLHENFNYSITDPDQFDDSTPLSDTFAQQRPDLEQAAFAEDLIRMGKWTVSAGIRWDHYQLLLNQNAFSPRLSIGRYVPSLKMVLHASLDRVFQPPSFENILISSSNGISVLDYPFLHLPVQPSRGTYYEGGLQQSLLNHARLDVNIYRRDVRNYADDDQLLNTGVSYPVAFDKAIIYGAEGKLSVINLQKLSGYLSYSYMVGNAWFPVTGGLFLGDDASAATTQTSGHFPDTQDQRNTLSTRFQYQLTPRLWLAAGTNYGSGLPFDFNGDEPTALAEYGPAVISRINFDRGRVRPQLSVDSSIGVDLHKSEGWKMNLQVDGENLSDRLNVIDFGGLFSGNAIGPARSVYGRLSTTF